MVALRKLIARFGPVNGSFSSLGSNSELILSLTTAIFIAIILYVALGSVAYAVGTKIPGEDASDQLKAAGTLLQLIDTGLFKWGARIFAGICIMSSGWALKEQRFGVAIICVVGAIIFGTAPTWVKNIFDIGGGTGVFSQVEQMAPPEIASRIEIPEVIRRA